MNEIRIYLKTEMCGKEQGLGTYYMTYFRGEWLEPPETEEWLMLQNKRRKCLYVSRTCMEVILLTDALKEIKGSAKVEIFSEVEQLYGVIKNWIPLWKERGWKDSKGETVRDEYKKLDTELSRHTLKDITIGKHEYSTGLETELHGVLQRGMPPYGQWIAV